jgi:hypothetical protein
MTESEEKKKLYAQLVTEELVLFIRENKKTIVKRAEKKLRAMIKSEN